MSSTPAGQSEAFAAFLASMDDRLSSFIAHGLPETVAVGEDERTFVKDLTPASLPWIEAYAASRLPSPALASAPENQRLAEDLMRYVGETFIRTLGGSWQHDPNGADHGMPFVRVPTSATGSAEKTINISVLGLLMTALQRRTGDVFVSVLLQTADADSDAAPGGQQAPPTEAAEADGDTAAEADRSDEAPAADGKSAAEADEDTSADT